jgi:hypothetical protein
VATFQRGLAIAAYSPVAAWWKLLWIPTSAEMTKEIRTREQLAEMVLKEAHATGKCADLHSVVVLGPVTQGRSNWHIGTSSNGPNLISAPCRMELNLIVGRLQAKYDLAGE